MIKPTVGRVVWFRPGSNDPLFGETEQPLAAIIAHVQSDNAVNLGVLDTTGNHHSRQSVQLVQDGEDGSTAAGYCEWMPYQKGQATKTEQLEKQLTNG